MFRKCFLELVCMVVLAAGFAGVAQAENAKPGSDDWFMAATKSAVSNSLDILAKTGVLPLAEAAQHCSITCGVVNRTSCSANCSPGETAICECYSCGFMGGGECDRCYCN